MPNITTLMKYIDYVRNDNYSSFDFYIKLKHFDAFIKFNPEENMSLVDYFKLLIYSHYDHLIVVMETNSNIKDFSNISSPSYTNITLNHKRILAKYENGHIIFFPVRYLT